jgi:hypothetical protein
VDAALGQAFDAAGGFERFIRDTTVIVTSDHGHCEILPDHDRAAIALDRLLGEFQLADLTGWREGDEILICPNMRAAQIYLRRSSGVLIDRVARTLLSDRRIDLVMWHSGLLPGSTGGYVVASQRGRLEFWRDEDGRGPRDAFGTAWRWRGEPTALELEHDADFV